MSEEEEHKKYKELLGRAGDTSTEKKASREDIEYIVRLFRKYNNKDRSTNLSEHTYFNRRLTGSAQKYASTE